MNMRDLFARACLVLAFCLLPALAAAQTAKTYVVLPFKVNDPKYQHLGPGAQSMLRSRLTLPGKFEPAPSSALGQAAAPASSSEVLNLLSKAGADYLVWGTINILGDRATVEVHRQDQKGNAKVLTQEAPIDQLVPAIDKIAKQTQAELFAATAPEQQAPGARGTQAAPNPAFVNAEGGGSAATNVADVNPEFRYEGGAETPGTWRSQRLDYPARGMAIGDVDGDRKQDCVILGDHGLRVYSLAQNRLTMLDEVKYAEKFEPLHVGLVDLDRDGTQEIVVGIHRNDGEPQSAIYTFKGRKLLTLAKNVRLYLAVVKTPPTFMPTLVGQKRGVNYLFDSRDVVECNLSGEKVVEGKRIALPEFANVYNFAFLPDAEGGYKVILVDDYSRLKVFTSGLDLQYTTEDTYNSSAIDLEFANALPGMGPGQATDFKSYYYIPIPMNIASISTKGKYELLVNKDISVAAQLFYRFRTFTQGELHALFWDGVGLNLAWKTRRIKGTVVQYQIADPDNDGKNDLCVLVNTYPGALALRDRKSLIMGFTLNEK